MYNDNRRLYARNSSDALVVMTHPSLGQITVKAQDLSDGGISVSMGHHPCPPVGTILDVVIKRHTGALNSQPIKMVVRHSQSNGTVGLSFV